MAHLLRKPAPLLKSAVFEEAYAFMAYLLYISSGASLVPGGFFSFFILT